MKQTNRILAGIVLGTFLATGMTSPAMALRTSKEAPSVTRLVPKGSAKAPLGMLLFCLKQAEHCRGGGASEIRLNADIMNVLKRVNTQVNRSIRPRNDKGDVWSVNVKSGDCEDYVLTKRAKLIQMGLPASALRIATARTRSGEGHAVLVVVTDQGDLVLDNRTRAIKPWNKTGLQWVAMSSANPKRWQSV